MEKIICKIYELKGIVYSMAELSEIDGQYEHPLLSRLEEITKEMLELVKE